MQETESQQDEGRVKTGLEILYARPGTKDDLADFAERNLASELRERYWIRQSEDAGIESRSLFTPRISMQKRIERRELGRNRNEPGDGFRYVFRSSTEGTEGHPDWFEVTEVFESVKAKDIKAFMRINNGGTAGFHFDPENFVRGLDMSMPCRAAQRRAADKVIEAVEKKIKKTSYGGMRRSHGYGTLIVGLPLWFAMLPVDPFRVKNVIDDFMTRVQIGLQHYERRLRKKTCPFWRIVVIWNLSLESLQEWSRKARFDVYYDPAERRMEDLPIRFESMMPQLLKIMKVQKVEQSDGQGIKGWTMYVAVARPEKKEKEKETFMKFPTALNELKCLLDDYGKRNREKLLERVKWRAKLRFLEVLCFMRAYGLAGMERWVIARLSPRHRITRLARRHQAHRLYHASRRRKR